MKRRKWPLFLPRGRQDGFTLIEVLVGLMLLALTMAFLPSAFRLGMHAWASRYDFYRLENLALITSALDQRISQAVPIFERDQRGGVRLLFEGSPTTLSFIGPIDTGPSGSGLFRIRLAATDATSSASDSAGLTIELAQYGGASPRNHASRSSHVVAGSDMSFRFRYFGAPKVGTPPQWNATWQRNDELPGMVEVSAELRSSRAHHVHRRIIVPRISIRS